MTLIRKSFDPHERDTIEFPATGRTKREFQEETDINHILKTWKTTGQVNHQNPVAPIYGDWTNVPNYQAAVDQVDAAEAAFDGLPADVRRRMDNNAATFVAFMSDPANADEARALKLLDPLPPDPPPPPKSDPPEDPPPEAEPPAETP